jgi:exopolysaccharide biosynthesis polyprenyl glycosylphosphotransferase
VLYHNVQVTAQSLRFVDALVLSAAAVGSVAMGRAYGLWSLASYEVVGFYAVANAIAFLALGLRLRVYHARRTEKLGTELFLLFEAALTSAALACLATQVCTPGMPGTVYVATLGIGISALLGLRLIMRLVIRRLRRRGGDERMWLIVGHNKRSVDITNEILRNRQYGIRIDEIVDLADPAKDLSRKLREPAAVPAGVKLTIIDDVEQIRDIITSRVIDDVVVTLPLRSHYESVSRILDICASGGVSVRLRPQVFEAQGYATELSYVGDIALVTHYNGPSNYGQLLLKRLIDIAGATAGLLLLLPAFAIIAALIKTGSPGPLFFRQTRVGLHGRHFEMLKFRSMVKDALQMREQLTARNERDGRAFKIRNDARITPIGRWLRKYRIDELPQLWNVLIGDMSLVGPRPFPVNEAHGFEWWQRRRHSMPPGLTCFWQLEDDPKMPLLDWMKLDMAYIDRWSVWLDLKLIARTFVTVMRGNGW